MFLPEGWGLPFNLDKNYFTFWGVCENMLEI